MRIGLDVGGTKIEAIALDDDGVERARERIATPAGDYDATLEAVATVAERVERLVRVVAGPGPGATIGIGIPGSLSPSTGLVRNANSTCLNGRALQTDLEARLGRPVRIENDANCFAVSEALDGAGADATHRVGPRVVFGVILGTGVGGGLVVDGSLVTGRNGIAGEWGHNGLPRIEDVDLPLPRCWCGRAGCIETYLSGPALLADHRMHGGVATTAAEVAACARAGDARAGATIERYARRLAKSLASIVNVVDPDVIVLGGGVSNIVALYDAVAAALPPFVFADALATPIVRNRHGDSSGVRGAAWLWPRHMARVAIPAPDVGDTRSPDRPRGSG